MNKTTVTINPVLRRELVERWRSRRAVVTLTMYLAVLGGLQYLLYLAGRAILDPHRFGGIDVGSAAPLLGRFLFEGLVFFVLLLVLFVAPGYAAAQVSGERERRTLTLLQVTLLRPTQIVLGKLGASVAWLTLLVLAALPVGAAAFFLGGVAPGDLLRSMGFIVGVGVSVAAMSIGISSLTRRTTASVVLTYGLVLGLVVGTLFLAGVSVVMGSRDRPPAGPPRVLYLNPFFGLADASRADSRLAGDLPSPLAIISHALPGSNAFVDAPAVGRTTADPAVMVAPDMAPRSSAADDGPMPVEPPLGRPAPEFEPEEPARQRVWLRVLVVYAGVGLAALSVAALRLRTTGRPRRAAAPVAVPAGEAS